MSEQAIWMVACNNGQLVELSRRGIAASSFWGGDIMAEKPVYSCHARGAKGVSGIPKRGMHWIMARRGKLHVFEDRIECGDWRLPFAEMTNVILYAAKQTFGAAHVLEVTTPNETYQFGLRARSKLEDYMSVPIERQDTKLKPSVYSIARISFIVVVGLWLIGTYAL
jgi:hypothetical protein